ncbi:putative sart-1 family protein [Diaporthe ampelina]|uniref:Putative sart-1 family protein n=1 Tax=Diaporthe ampelina TaxID=1214573 RepID=A0A0G2FSU3_9PEZI|nr:putative sart-1 family protein [Diaporthe ampelina]
MDANTIQELNEVRKAMGLKPLPVPNASPAPPKQSSKDDTEEVASTIETREAAAGDNYRKVLQAEKAKRDREAKIAAIKKERDRAQRLAILKGQGLGDLDDEDDGDAKSWLKSMKKKQKKIAESRRQEEEADAAAAAARKAAEYSSKDLAGVKVGHDMSTLLDGDDQVLTLKDSAVLGEDDEGDELENLSLREQEKLNEKLNLKKKRPVYDPNEIDETGERSILSQYDEEINGKKKKTFNLDGNGTISDLADILEAPAQRKRMLQNLDVDIMQDAPVSDYLDPSEIKVKKPKKKKKAKSTRQRDVEDALFPGDQAPAADEAMDIDSAPTARKRKIIDDTFVDDEDLQASLSIQRRQALKKQRRVRPEDLAKQLRAEAAQDAGNEEHEAESGGLVLDETSEFLSAINKPEADEDSRPRKKSKSREPVTAMDDEASDEEMENAPQIKEESAERDVSAAPEELATTGVDEEKYVAQGLGATLSLLKERKIIDENDTGAEKNEHFRRRELFLAEQARLVAQIDEDAKRQRERDRASGHLDRMNARDREEYARRQNAEREFKLSSIRANLLKKHKFNVELKYVDEQGRHLNQKEAFKELSHQFHGKTSGKGKTDKKLSKIEQEKSRISKSIFDASGEAGISSATAQQTKKRKEAGVRLA